MSYLLTTSSSEFEARTTPYRELMAPYLTRVDAALARADELARYVEASYGRDVPLLLRYRRIVAWPVRQLEYSFVLEQAAPAAGGRMLDAGCGITPLAHIYAAHGAEAHGVDGDPKLIELLTRDAGALFGENVTHAFGDITGLEYPDESFDTVVSISVLEHLPRGLDTVAVREMLRVLKPGGKLVLTVDVVPTRGTRAPRVGPRELARRVRRWIRGRKQGPKRTTPYTPAEVHRQLLEPFASVLTFPRGRLEELDVDTVVRFWTENWFPGCGYDPVAGRRYTALGMVFTKPHANLDTSPSSPT